MLTVIQDGDAIFSGAIAIGSPEEREVYIAKACGQDAVLRRQVQERVAAHFQAKHAEERSATGTANGAVSSRTNHEQTSIPHVHRHEEAAKVHPAEKEKPKSSRLIRFLAVLMLASMGVGIGLAIWGMRTQKRAERALQEAKEKQEHALQAEEQSRHQREEAEKARLETASARDRAVEDEKAEKSSLEDMKAALAFFQGRVLSPGRSLSWTEGKGKEVTLRQAVDNAESRVAEAFPDRPLAEATTRELLGATYMDLNQPKLAVKEYERALALREALQGEQNADTNTCRNELEVAYRKADRPADASRLTEVENQTPTHAAALAIRADMLLAEKKPVEAEKLLRECLALREKRQPDDWSTFEARAMLGQALAQQKKYADAEPLLRAGCEGMKQRADKIPPQDKPFFIKALERLVQFYDAENQKDKADQWRTELERIKSPPKS